MAPSEISTNGSRPSRRPQDARPPGRARQRAFMIAALPAGEEDQLDELEELLRTAGVAAVGRAIQHRDAPHPNSYLGPGKLEELRAELKAADANVVACDDELTPRQERNLEKALEMPVVDRTAVILDIFADHAHTAEGKLQVELAQLEYNLARMRGLWTHLERLGGGIGTRGPGESQIETDRRLARDRISALKRRLAHVRSTRGVMRAERERAHLPQVALAGYTNAGKSTLLNALTGADVPVRDRLFHTLDPTTRVMRSGGRDYLITDTVGFIRKLPHQLVDAFGATLEETIRADLILHVADASADEEELQSMTRAVEDVLEEIHAGDAASVLVLSKADQIDAERRTELAHRHPEAMLVSARTGEGLPELVTRIETEFRRRLAPVELLVPYREGGRLAELHEIAGDLERVDTPDGVRISARLPAGVAARFAPFRLSAASKA
ncbi:MAG TPA: GTPase HflX [Solirubrobacteraceae bacterium]|nr:GTPase HflX [Solirubrobacteraceae bacterium]